LNILSEVLKHDVFPALGCTEPIAVAYAASAAGKQLDGEISGIHISVDPGVYKNGFAVAIPNTGGERGNLIAGVLGALIRRPELKMEVMSCISEAANNLISDLGGMLCDGAKEGCALKVASSTNSAIRSAHMALNNHGISHVEGYVGTTPEDTIRNLSQIGAIGMSLANDTMLNIMIEKSSDRTDSE